MCAHARGYVSVCEYGCVSFYLLYYFPVERIGRTLRSECKIDQIDFKDCISISYLPSRPMEEISPYLEALSANTVSFQFTWNSQKDINNLDIML